jgi:hypothetical protein
MLYLLMGRLGGGKILRVVGKMSALVEELRANTQLKLAVLPPRLLVLLLRR